jgi:tetratricopeptide (TPR) repeat protein
MRTSEQISSVLSVARESSFEGERLRRRIAAIAAVTLLLGGFLTSIGLGLIVLAFFGGLVVSFALVAAVAAWPESRRRVAAASGQARSVARRGLAWGNGSAWPRVRRRVVGGRRRVDGLARRGIGRAAATRIRVSPRVAGITRWARATAIRFAPRPARIEPQREAIRLNAEGTQHRRSGRYDEAVECHRRALEILRELGDRRGVALTQSNLALAVSRSGDHDWAIGLFEEAAATLHDLGDEEREAQIMANLGLAHRRHGRHEEGDNVLELALAKLDPESSAYHTIEAELRRAS